MTDYAQELATRSSPAYIARSVTRIRQIDAMYGAWLRKYHGGMPVGFLATIVFWESNGQQGTAGDASLGEVGLMQIAKYVPPIFGLPDSIRYSPEGNIFVGCLEYQYEAARWKKLLPNHVELGSPTSWKLARLTFSIGYGGATGLAAQAINAGYYKGDLYDALVRYVDATGGVPLGSQSAAQVWFRTKSIAIQWAMGEQVGGLFDMSGPPTKIPAPAGVSYTIPASLAPYFSSGFPWLIFGALGLGGYALWRLV